MKILVTAFEPFNKEKLNASQEVLKKLPEQENIQKLLLPVVFRECFIRVYREMEKTHFDYVLMLGESGGRASVSLERIAVNIADSSIPDNKGNIPKGERIFPDGENAYFTTLNLKTAKDTLNKNGIPVQISNSAGLYVCNNLFYGVMHYIKKNDLKTKAGFMHIPFLEAQTVHKPNVPSISLQSAVSVVNILIALMEQGTL